MERARSVGERTTNHISYLRIIRYAVPREELAKVDLLCLLEGGEVPAKGTEVGSEMLDRLVGDFIHTTFTRAQAVPDESHTDDGFPGAILPINERPGAAWQASTNEVV